MSRVFNRLLGLTGGNKPKPVFAINGYTDGSNCAGGGDVIVNYSVSLIIADFALGVSITHDNSGTFTIVNGSSSVTDNVITYSGSWDVALAIGDIVSYAYEDLVGDYTDSNSIQVPDQAISINNCESKTADGFYITGSIYDGTKDLTTAWIAEPIASGVNTIWCRNITPATVNIGYGSTAALASSTIYTINSGDSILLQVSGNYIAWKGSVAGTMSIEQSVSR